YQKAVIGFLDQDEMPTINELPSLVGSLSFSGKIFEARQLYKEQHKNLNDIEKAACRFFLGLGYTRKSQYQKASKIFRTNLLGLHKKSNPLQRFYVYQGIAFYLFFLGKLELSMKWALKSFNSASDAKDLYGRSLSTDLLAHIKLRLGEINVGMDLLKSAEKLAIKMGNRSISEVVKLTDLQYQAQYGYDRENILTILETKFGELVTEDNYTRAAIGLELARQYTLRGRYDLSEGQLEKISSNIFATENRRQEIQLNLRFAENFYRMGKPSLAWNYLRSARRCLNFEADKSFEIQIMGFEYKLFDESMRIGLAFDLQEKARLFNSVINHNILSRNKIEAGSIFNQEDLFHNFLLSIETDEHKVSKIIESGYLSLLPEAVGIRRGEELFYFDQETNRVILFYDNRIEVPGSKLTPTDTKLLLAILAGKQTKEEICKKVWGYVYDPIRHDNIIYTGIRSLRKNLGSGGAWIETSENGYHFKEDRRFKINFHKQEVTNKTDVGSLLVIPDEELESFSSQLNLRQFKSIQYLKVNEFLDVLSYQKIFSVSDVTASRDLRSLKELGFVVSIGKARATKYLLAGK
ncbi:MAG: hypothetical protein K2Q18_09645, partial [Bdellovibrionales bacterium]|nr:hypothetical protein [Bdellovibrionales bacterium]